MNISTTFNCFQPTQSTQSSFKTALSEESAEILKRLKKINIGYFFRPDKVLVSKLKAVNPVELSKVLKQFFMEMVQENAIANPVKFLDRLAAVIPFAKMQESLADDVGDALKEAQGMFEEAKLYLQTTNGNTSPSIKARISSILDEIVSVIESIIVGFGIADFFRPPESDLHADFKSRKILMLLNLFSIITAIILPLIGAATAGIVIGAIFLAIAALSIAWPYIKPRITYLPANAENLTKQVQNSGFTGEGRKESLDEIADILKMNRHAILVGPSRVGKSLTAKAFAQAIERGDYPELRGKVVFRINAADLVDYKSSSSIGGGNNILNKISVAMGRHRNNIILVIDEIHMACKNKEKIADQLKTFLDEGGEFPHVIGITTEEEYNKHVKPNTAFSLRLDRVDIKNTSRDETLKILSDTVLRSRSKPIIEENVLDQIYDKSCEAEDAPQPSSALKLLKHCINRTQKTQTSPTEKKMMEVSNKILSLRSQVAASRGRKKGVKEQIADLERQMKDLQETISIEKEELSKLYKSKSLLDRVTKETYLSILKVSAIGQKTLNAKNEKQLNRFLMLHGFLSQALESHIAEKSEALGIKTIIDDALLKETIEQ